MLHDWQLLKHSNNKCAICHIPTINQTKTKKRMNTNDLIQFLKLAKTVKNDFVSAKPGSSPTKSFAIIGGGYITCIKKDFGIRMMWPELDFEPVAVDVDTLMAAVVSHGGAGDVRITKNSYTAKVSTANGTTEMTLNTTYQYSKDWMVWPTDDEGCPEWRMDARAIALAKRGLLFVSNDITLPVLCRVIVTPLGQVVSTDEILLVQRGFGTSGPDEDIKVGDRTIAELGGLLLSPAFISAAHTIGNGANMRISAMHTVAFLGRGVSIYQYNERGKYPNWRAVWPSGATRNVILCRMETMKALQRLSPLTNKTTCQIEMHLHNGGSCELVVDNREDGIKTSVDLTVHHKREDVESPEGYRIGFNASLLMRMLKDIDGGVLSISMNGPNDAVVMNGSHMIMPVMLIK